MTKQIKRECNCFGIYAHERNCPQYCSPQQPLESKGWEKYFKKWASQGRTEEQIWAVRNFMTGQGAIMLSQQRIAERSKLIEKIREKKKGMICNEHKDCWINNGIENYYNQALDEVLSLIREEGGK